MAAGRSHMAAVSDVTELWLRGLEADRARIRHRSPSCQVTDSAPCHNDSLLYLRNCHLSIVVIMDVIVTMETRTKAVISKQRHHWAAIDIPSALNTTIVSCLAYPNQRHLLLKHS